MPWPATPPSPAAARHDDFLQPAASHTMDRSLCCVPTRLSAKTPIESKSTKLRIMKPSPGDFIGTLARALFASYRLLSAFLAMIAMFVKMNLIRRE